MTITVIVGWSPAMLHFPACPCTKMERQVDMLPSSRQLTTSKNIAGHGSKNSNQFVWVRSMVLPASWIIDVGFTATCKQVQQPLIIELMKYSKNKLTKTNYIQQTASLSSRKEPKGVSPISFFHPCHTQRHRNPHRVSFVIARPSQNIDHWAGPP